MITFKLPKWDLFTDQLIVYIQGQLLLLFIFIQTKAHSASITIKVWAYRKSWGGGRITSKFSSPGPASMTPAPDASGGAERCCARSDVNTNRWLDSGDALMTDTPGDNGCRSTSARPLICAEVESSVGWGSTGGWTIVSVGWSSGGWATDSVGWPSGGWTTDSVGWRSVIKGLRACCIWRKPNGGRDACCLGALRLRKLVDSVGRCNGSESYRRRSWLADAAVTVGVRKDSVIIRLSSTLDFT